MAGSEGGGNVDAERPGGSEPLGAKPRGLVARVIRQPWLATAFVGAAAVVLLLPLLTIIALQKRPSEAEQARVEAAELALSEERKNHSETRDALKRASADDEEAERRAKRAEALLEVAEAARKELRSRAFELTEQLGAERRGRQALEQRHKAFVHEASREKAETRAERDAASKEAANLRERTAKLQADYAELRKQRRRLLAAADEAEKVSERVRAVFEMIVEAASKVEDPTEKIAMIERLREDSKAMLEGTPYIERLDSMVARERRLVEEGELAGLEVARTGEVAPAEREEVLKETASPPKAHEEDLDALEDAMERTERDYLRDYDDSRLLESFEAAVEQMKGIRYAGRLERMVEDRRKALKNEPARAAYRQVLARTKWSPDDYEENLAAAEAALPKTEGTRYEARLRYILKYFKAALRKRQGREAHEAERARPTQSPRDYAANVAVLEVFKADAEGSRWETETEKLLQSPRDSFSYWLRAMSHLVLGNVSEAEADLRRSAELSPDDPYRAVYHLAYVLVKEGKPNEAIELASDCLDRRGDNLKPWQRALLEYFAGKRTEQDLLALAAEEDEEKTGMAAKQKLCEACFYVGMMRICSGDAIAGEELLRKCLATQVTRYSEYGAAKMWLSRRPEGSQ